MSTDCPESIEKLKARLDALKRGAAHSRLGVSRMDRIRAKVFRRVLSHKPRVVRPR